MPRDTLREFTKRFSFKPRGEVNRLACVVDDSTAQAIDELSNGITASDFLRASAVTIIKLDEKGKLAQVMKMLE